MCVTRSEDKQHSLVSSYWHYLQYIIVRWLHLEGSFINHDDMTGGGGCQMSLLLHKPYSVKCSTKGDTKMSNKMSTWFMDDPWQLTLHCKLSYKIVFIGMHYYSKVWNKRHFACSEKKCNCNFIETVCLMFIWKHQNSTVVDKFICCTIISVMYVYCRLKNILVFVNVWNHIYYYLEVSLNKALVHSA